MNTMVRPESLLQVVEEIEDLGLHRHVERGDRLVADQQVGSGIRARAMLIRWHWPPENSLGRRSPASSGSIPTASSMLRTCSARSSLVPRPRSTAARRRCRAPGAAG